MLIHLILVILAVIAIARPSSVQSNKSGRDQVGAMPDFWARTDCHQDDPIPIGFLLQLLWSSRVFRPVTKEPSLFGHRDGVESHFVGLFIARKRFKTGGGLIFIPPMEGMSREMDIRMEGRVVRSHQEELARFQVVTAAEVLKWEDQLSGSPEMFFTIEQSKEKDSEVWIDATFQGADHAAEMLKERRELYVTLRHELRQSRWESVVSRLEELRVKLSAPKKSASKTASPTDARVLIRHSAHHEYLLACLP